MTNDIEMRRIPRARVVLDGLCGIFSGLVYNATPSEVFLFSICPFSYALTMYSIHLGNSVSAMTMVTVSCLANGSMIKMTRATRRYADVSDSGKSFHSWAVSLLCFEYVSELFEYPISASMPVVSFEDCSNYMEPNDLRNIPRNLLSVVVSKSPYSLMIIFSYAFLMS